MNTYNILSHIIKYKNIKNSSVELRYLSYDTDEICYVVQPNEDIDFYLENITITELNNFIRIEKRKEKILKIKQMNMGVIPFIY